jgi:hypothetical protein
MKTNVVKYFGNKTALKEKSKAFSAAEKALLAGRGLQRRIA